MRRGVSCPPSGVARFSENCGVSSPTSCSHLGGSRGLTFAQCLSFSPNTPTWNLPPSEVVWPPRGDLLCGHRLGSGTQCHSLWIKQSPGATAGSSPYTPASWSAQSGGRGAVLWAGTHCGAFPPGSDHCTAEGKGTEAQKLPCYGTHPGGAPTGLGLPRACGVQVPQLGLNLLPGPRETPKATAL